MKRIVTFDLIVLFLLCIYFLLYFVIMLLLLQYCLIAKQIKTVINSIQLLFSMT